MRAILVMILFMLTINSAGAVDANECKLQRAQYPQNWNDVSKEKGLFDCTSHYSGALRITIGDTDSGGRTLMSLVPLKESDGKPVEDTSKTIYRIWLDSEQTSRLKDGKYFATIVRMEKSCWIRGDLAKDPVFFMDNANPPPDGLRPGTGSFYNKAPRFSVFQANAYDCAATK
jgi:hypothetical protein